MSPRTHSRPFDVVLLGATGFTGALAAEYLAAHLPPGARLALAGRNQAKLEAVRDRLLRINQQLDDIALLHADSSDEQSLARVAESTRVVITTVGPYLEYGEPLVAACAAAGTDYVDLTGEPEFVDRMYVEHHATAERTGARIVHACGFDSIPHDLGVLFTVQQLPAGVPVTLRGVVRTNATISGGTLHSGLGQLSRPRAMLQAAAGRRRLEPRPRGRRVRTRIGRPRRDRTLGTWLIPLPTIDPDVVRRSALAHPDYGPDFTYSHYAGARRVATVAGALAGSAVALAAVQVPLLRRAVGRRIPQGEGPSAERRDRTWFTVDIIGEGGGQTVHTQVSGADPGYTETAKMLAEAALCLAFDDNPPTAGQVTTATAMGENLLRRLGDAGISFTVIASQTATHVGR
ncbi:saccharopine dehydrogenase NADP-binding domain-containing protein [Streptomyces sp. Go40/10]|uniref:saccharopine dehydrogenase family protein n=1 Tax=Streptomyces sp. Go40/10 TaxID=2825844 RepID=UPI001E65094A|nr:saccharopine dehydrogenase NADP-binding domain-containing protein [Streptomyces sp. Go40/10]UFQ99925.1 saccharopine dehydrogenase NADP-binding domain-containing protein [Streptomyces sp. Go40/10]